MPRSRARFTGTAGLCLLFAVACSSSDTPTLPVEHKLTTLEVTPSRITLNPGEFVQMVVVARDETGRVMPSVRPVFTTSSVDVASVDIGGRVWGLRPGSATITVEMTIAGVTGMGETVVTVPVTPVPFPSAPLPPASGWSVTIQTVADEGPDFCIHLPAVGSTFEGVYQLVEHGDTVRFIGPDPVDWGNYTAIRSGQAFTAAYPPAESAHGMCTHYLQASALSGTFSADNKSFTATETWWFTLDSGQVKTIKFSWVGTAL